MTQIKTSNLRNQMCGEFSEIYQLCKEVLDKAQKPSLIKATLETLLRFLNWIPLGYIFETDLIETLRTRVSQNQWGSGGWVRDHYAHSFFLFFISSLRLLSSAMLRSNA